MLGELNGEGKTIIVVTHDMALVAEHAKNVAVLSDGKLRYHGPTEKLFAQQGPPARRPSGASAARRALCTALPARPLARRNLYTGDGFLETFVPASARET